MKCLLIILIALTGYCGVSFSQDGEDRQPRREDKRGNQTLTTEQKAKVKAILSKYDPATLTAKDARAIHEEFRKAGLRGGPDMREVVEEAGFDFDQLRDLAPDPRRCQDRQDEKGQEPHEMQEDEEEQHPQHEIRDDREEQKPQCDTRNERPKKDKSEGRNQDRRGNSQKYSLEQAISDRAQLHTIAFSGLAFITGDFGASTFIPPGKVCDFFGFQYMRDIDAAGKGHNPMFLNRVAGNVLHILNSNQKQLFLNLASEQAQELEVLARMRLPLIKAFCMQLENKLPSGSTGLNKEAVIQYVGNIFAKDAELSLKRAEIMAKVWNSLSSEQKTYLGKMKFGDFNTWPAMDERDKMKREGKGKSKLYNVAYMTYASEFFSWTAGSLEADTYFCPERHGTYFGGFYMKDMPAMGKRDYDISTSITGNSGESFINNVLTESQRYCLTEIPDKQRRAMREIVDVRREISKELRKLLKGETPSKEKVLSLGRRYGELDGEVSWYYTMSFGKVNQTLSSQQRMAAKKLRNLEGYKSAPYYIYSQEMRDEPNLQGINNFFFVPKYPR